MRTSTRRRGRAPALPIISATPSCSSWLRRLTSRPACRCRIHRIRSRWSSASTRRAAAAGSTGAAGRRRRRWRHTATSRSPPGACLMSGSSWYSVSLNCACRWWTRSSSGSTSDANAAGFRACSRTWSNTRVSPAMSRASSRPRRNSGFDKSGAARSASSRTCCPSDSRRSQSGWNTALMKASSSGPIVPSKMMRMSRSEWRQRARRP